MKKFNQSLMKEHLTRAEMRSISGGSSNIIIIGGCGFACEGANKSCRSRQCTCDHSTDTCVTIT